MTSDSAGKNVAWLWCPLNFDPQILVVMVSSDSWIFGICGWTVAILLDDYSSQNPLRSYGFLFSCFLQCQSMETLRHGPRGRLAILKVCADISSPTVLAAAATRSLFTVDACALERRWSQKHAKKTAYQVTN